MRDIYPSEFEWDLKCRDSKFENHMECVKRRAIYRLYNNCPDKINDFKSSANKFSGWFIDQEIDKYMQKNCPVARSETGKY